MPLPALASSQVSTTHVVAATEAAEAVRQAIAARAAAIGLRRAKACAGIVESNMVLSRAIAWTHGADGRVFRAIRKMADETRKDAFGRAG